MLIKQSRRGLLLGGALLACAGAAGYALLRPVPVTKPVQVIGDGMKWVNAVGVPAVNFGPGDPLVAHQDEERCAIAQVEQAYERLHAWLTSSRG